MKLTNHKGKRFGRLLVLGRSENKNTHPCWECRCDCGTILHVRARALVSGNTKSCGCYRREVTAANRTLHGHKRNRVATEYYTAWTNMNGRCYNPNREKYKDYGARGIQVCSRWHKGTDGAFENFLSDMGEKPGIGHSIDRINNDLHYMPSNCRWATATEQVNNRRVR